VAEGIAVAAPAKINLILRVLYRRPDGYHELYTVFQKVTLFDRLELIPCGGLQLEVCGEIEVPRGEENLCYRAARLYFDRCGLDPGVKIRLEKNIPVGAGLGGGSSDAAAVLRGLNQLFGSLTEEDLFDLARRLGADVPFFVSPLSTALARGIGEVLSPWPTHPAWYVILCPEIEISTPWAYENLRLTTRREPPNYEPDQPLWKQGLVNDFEPAIFARYPLLEELKGELLKKGACAALLTGSGAALFGVFEEEARAEKAALFFRKKDLRAEVVTNY